MQHLHDPVMGSKNGATIEATESLIAQLHSQSKLTTPRRKNQKIRHENEILNGKDHELHV
jgi:hydroxymethylpyrimidine/phosphomethylpyrimidine kinase